MNSYGITANIISARTMDTKAIRNINQDASKHIQNSRNRIAAYRPMEIVDVANIALNLCSKQM
ncbi:SDR family oxidoreductase [Bacillaceae bacterium S4-13-56]